MRRSGPGLRESILLQLSQLVAITRQHIAPYLPAIIDILKTYWTEHLEYVLAIVQQIALTTAETFLAFLPMLLPLLLSSLAVPRSVRCFLCAVSYLLLNVSPFVAVAEESPQL